MSTYSTFANLLKDQATHSVLPQILFTENADLRGSTLRLALATTGDQDVSTENIVSAVEELDALRSSELSVSRLFLEYENIASAFAKKLNEGIESLHSVKDDVSALKEKCDESTAMRIAEDATLSKVCGIERELSVEPINWAYLDSVDERYLVTELHDKIGHDPDRVITRSILDMVINAMPCANSVNKVDLKPIVLDKTKLTSCIDKLCNFIPEESVEFVAGMFSNLLNLNDLGCELAIKKARTFVE